MHLETLEGSAKQGEEPGQAWSTKMAAHKVANTGNRYAHMCHNGWIQKAISTKRLTSYGLVLMLDYYTKRCVTC